MRTNHKIALWHALVVLLSLWMWGSGAHAQFSSITGVALEVPSLAAFLLLTSAIVIGYALFRAQRQEFWLWPLMMSAIVGGLFMIQFGFTWLNLTAVAIFLALNYESYKRVGNEVSQRIKVNIAEILKKGLMPIVIGIFIMISFAAYQSSLADQLKSDAKLPSQTYQFFQKIAGTVGGSQLDDASPRERQSIINQVATEAYQQANKALKPYFRYAPPALAFGLFLILWGLSWLFVSVAMLVGMFLFWLLKKTGTVQIQERDVKAESIIV